MYEVKEYTLERDNFLGGARIPVAKEMLAAKEGEVIAYKSLVKLDGKEAVAYTAADAEASTPPYGIAATDAENGAVVVYLSGEFQESGLILPDGVEVDTVRPLLRENGIFLVQTLKNADNQ